MKKQPDFPYVALAQQPDGSVILVDWRKPPGETHRTVREAGSLARLEIDLGDIDCHAGIGDIYKNPQAKEAGATAWSEALKVSRVGNASIAAGVCVGGYEDVIDATDCGEVLVRITKGYVNGKYFSTIKGGTDGFQLQVGTQVGHGKETDHDLGNWYDYNGHKTKRVFLDVETHDGSAAKCRALHADKPQTEAGQRWEIVSPWWAPFFYPVMRVLKALKLA